MARMNRKTQTTRGTQVVAWGMLAAAALAVSAGEVCAQAPNPGASPNKSQPVRRGRVMKPTVVNLEGQAGVRRSGQVMPGDPPPEKFAAPAESATPAVPASTPPAPTAKVDPPVAEPAIPISLPTSSEPAREVPPRRPVKPAPTPVEPDSGPRPLPRMPDQSAKTPAMSEMNEGMATQSASADSATLDSGVTPEPGSAMVSAEPGVAAGMREVTPSAPRMQAADPSPARPEWATADVSVVSSTGQGAEWRIGEGAWSELSVSARQTGRVEIRTGAEGDVIVSVNDRVDVRVAPMSRVFIERRTGTPAVSLERGSVDLRARSAEPVETWVRTPDRRAGFTSWPGVRIVYNAFSGTSVQTPANSARP